MCTHFYMSLCLSTGHRGLVYTCCWEAVQFAQGHDTVGWQSHHSVTHMLVFMVVKDRLSFSFIYNMFKKSLMCSFFSLASSYVTTTTAQQQPLCSWLPPLLVQLSPSLFWYQPQTDSKLFPSFHFHPAETGSCRCLVFLCSLRAYPKGSSSAGSKAGSANHSYIFIIPLSY